MVIIVESVEYSFANAPYFVQHAIRLLVAKWGSDFDNSALVQPFAKVKALDLARRFATPHP
jgi:hypothetical protein